MRKSISKGQQMKHETDEAQAAPNGQVDRFVRLVRAPKTNGYQLQEGDKFTIDGWGTSARGHQVCNGRSVKTKRRMKVKSLRVFVVTKTSA